VILAASACRLSIYRKSSRRYYSDDNGDEVASGPLGSNRYLSLVMSCPRILPVPAHYVDNYVGGSEGVVEVDRTAAPHLHDDQVRHGQARHVVQV
jgi:hypothetical protein